MLILLVGPKGSGKSHIGRLLERELGVHFFHVEPHWLEYYAECRATGRKPGIAGGIARVHPQIRKASEVHRALCVETTGASAEILTDLLALAPEGQRLVARVSAPVELCLERIAARDPTHQIPVDVETCAAVYALSAAADVPADLVLQNIDLPDTAIVEVFATALARSAPTVARVTVRYRELEDAFDFVSSGQPLENEAYLCIQTGEFRYCDSFDERFPESADQLDELDRCIAIPHKNHLNLGARLARQFVYETLPDLSPKVEDIFRRRGAYGRFKSLLERRGVLDEWYEYEARHRELALRQWCAENGIAIED